MAMGTIIHSKTELEILVAGNLPKYPQVKLHFDRTIENLFRDRKKTLLDLLEIPLFRYLAINSPSIKYFEDYISEHAFANVKTPLSRLRGNLEEEYHAVIGELQAAKLLKEEGATDILFLPQSKSNPDLEFKKDGEIKYAEVKNLKTISPETSILHDKLHAKSLVDPVYQRDFVIKCKYENANFDSVDTLHSSLRSSVDKLIGYLSPKLHKGEELSEGPIEIDEFSFEVTTHEANNIEFLLLTMGDSWAISNFAEDCFLELNSVYTRFISQFKKGYSQLLNKREGRKELVKRDRLYFFLNIDKYKSVFPEEIKEIFAKLSGATGMSGLVDLRVEL